MQEELFDMAEMAEEIEQSVTNPFTAKDLAIKSIQKDEQYIPAWAAALKKVHTEYPEAKLESCTVTSDKQEEALTIGKGKIKLSKENLEDIRAAFNYPVLVYSLGEDSLHQIQLNRFKDQKAGDFGVIISVYQKEAMDRVLLYEKIWAEDVPNSGIDEVII